MTTFLTVIHIITCVLLILVILIQSGKGAEISASFSGSSQTVFGSSGGANFFTRFTQVAAVVFFATSLTLTLMGGATKKSLFESASPAPSSGQIPVPQNPADAKAPAVPAPGTPTAANGATAPVSGTMSVPAAPQQPAKTTH